MTPDDLPVINNSITYGNLFIASGHGMLGLTMATGTGKIISDMVYGKPPDINAAPFSLSRF